MILNRILEWKSGQPVSNVKLAEKFGFFQYCLPNLRSLVKTTIEKMPFYLSNHANQCCPFWLAYFQYCLPNLKSLVKTTLQNFPLSLNNYATVCRDKLMISGLKIEKQKEMLSRVEGFLKYKLNTSHGWWLQQTDYFQNLLF